MDKAASTYNFDRITGFMTEIFVVFPRPSRRMSVQYLEMDHENFIPITFLPFTISYRPIRRSITFTIETVLLNKLTPNNLQRLFRVEQYGKLPINDELS